MGRKVKRVPFDFDWPLNEVWAGFEMPKAYLGQTCQDCGGTGYGPLARLWNDKWYGKTAFDPAETGSTPWQPDDPVVVANIRDKMARETGVDLDVDGLRLRFYGTADPAEQERLEAIRMCGIWNREWRSHLAEEDLTALRATEWLARLFDEGEQLLTAAEVNEKVIQGRVGLIGWPIGVVGVCLEARCAAAGEPVYCPTCDGEGLVWNSRVHKQLYDEWQGIDPPAGEGWQVWETVSDGSPITPVYATAEELIAALVADGYEEAAATAFVKKTGWVPSLLVTGLGEVIEDIATATLLTRGNESGREDEEK